MNPTASLATFTLKTSALTRSSLALAIVASLGALSACGGGGSSGGVGAGSFNAAVASDANLTLKAGTTMAISGSAQTVDSLLTAMYWTSTAPVNSPTLGAANATCAVSNKQTSKTSSAWDCPLTLTAPAVAADTTYNLVFTATDDQKNTRTVNRSVTVTYDPAYVVQGASIAGLGYSVVSGDSAPLSCVSNTGSTVVWSVVDNGGLPLNLTSYSAAQTSFVAPTVTVATPITLACKVTSASGTVTTGNVIVTVRPVVTVAVPPGFTISAAQKVKSGDAVTVTATGATGIYYQWLQVGGVTPALDLAGVNTGTVSFVAPVVTVATTYKLLVIYGTQPIGNGYSGVGSVQSVVVVTP